MLERFDELLSFAIMNKSTDIHFEIIKNKLLISVRTIAGFKKFDSKPIDFELLQYLKYVSDLNLLADKQPQSGAFSYVFLDEEYYFRTASIKSQFMEVCVIRILNKFFVSDEIFVDIKEDIDILLTQESGLIIFSGPTGSGKTTSMYTLMQMFFDKKIYSIEDPIEIFFDNIVQISVNNKSGFTYQKAIAQVLRHDPDIICIGEIRDEYAAAMAIRAAYTGHLVLCTIHAKSAKQTINRLMDLKVNENDILDNVIFIGNQRLIIDEKNQKRKSIYEIYQK